MNLLRQTLDRIAPLDHAAMARAHARQDRLTKPPGSLGRLEDLAARLAGLAGTCPPPQPEPAAVAVFAADHGVHARGVTAWPQEVTAQMVDNICAGGAVVNAFAAQVGATVLVVDVGVRAALPARPGLLARKLAPGTDDLATGPAMTVQTAVAAVETGIEVAGRLGERHRCLLTGELGLGNTTAAAALVAAFTGRPAEEVTGRGAGADGAMLERKIDVVRGAVRRLPDGPADPLTVLASVGGLEHAALAGFILGAAARRIPVLLDGVSAGAAALAAAALAPDATAAMVAGHRSVEPGHRAALDQLGLRPVLDLGLRLGEGTGALLALPVVGAAVRALREVATFDSAGVDERAPDTEEAGPSPAAHG